MYDFVVHFGVYAYYFREIFWSNYNNIPKYILIPTLFEIHPKNSNMILKT